MEYSKISLPFNLLGCTHFVLNIVFQDCVLFSGDGLGPHRTSKIVLGRIVGSNKKERRRTQSINAAFSSLRDCIPNVPQDTKLSKVSSWIHELKTDIIKYKESLSIQSNPSNQC